MIRFYLFFLAIFITVTGNTQNFEWAVNFGGSTTATEMGISIVVDQTGNSYSVGTFDGTVDFDPGPGVFNLTTTGTTMYMLKLNASGSFVWAKQIGGIGSGNVSAGNIYISSSADLYITGNFSGGNVDFDPGPGTFPLQWDGNLGDLFVLKLDSLGSFQWAKAINSSGISKGIAVKTDDAGNVFFTGHFGGTTDFDPGVGVYTLNSQGANDIFLLKLDMSGNFIWVKSMGSVGIDTSKSIDLDNTGSVYLTGSFQGTVDFDPGPGVFNLTTNNSYGEIYTVKLDSAGNLIWAGSIGGPSGCGGVSNSITIDSSGNSYITGKFCGTLDFDPGMGTYNLTAVSWDAFVLKLGPNGDFIWANQIDGGYDSGESIKVDLFGNIYVSGNIGFNGSDIFVYKYDAIGNIVWTYIVGDTLTDLAFSVAVDYSGNVFLTGWFAGIVDFDAGVATYNLTAAGNSDIFILKISQCTPPAISLSPSGVNLCNGDSSVFVTVNATGGTSPYTYLWSNGQTTQTVTGLAAGAYSVIVIDDSSCAVINSFSVSDPPAIISNISSTPTNFISPNCNGSASINPTGGTPPYNISWSSGSTTNLCEGWHTATVTDANGCVKTDSVYVDFVTGIEVLNVDGISVYPNPAKDILTINSQKELGEIKIYDVVGKLIYHKLIKNNIAEIDVKEFDAGIYFVEAENYRGKFVKR